jgi:hypothetical protein
MDRHHIRNASTVVVDCATCPVRGSGCDDCFVATLLDPSEGFDQPTRRAVAALRSAGLVGPVHLALVAGPTGRPRSDAPGVAAGERRVG